MGVAIYCRNHVAFKERPGVSSNEIESIWIEVPPKKKRLMIGMIFRPSDMKGNYWPKLTIILNGDLNCNLFNHKTKLGEILEDLNMKQIINEPRHYTDNNSTLIDI